VRLEDLRRRNLRRGKPARRAAERRPQPAAPNGWRFLLTSDTLEIHAGAPLRPASGSALDEAERRSLIDAGRVLFEARSALSSSGTLQIERLPDPDQPSLIARISFAADQPAGRRPPARPAPHEALRGERGPVEPAGWIRMGEALQRGLDETVG
jgi:hypothetical protein